jgi:hypothetical protein
MTKLYEILGGGGGRKSVTAQSSPNPSGSKKDVVAEAREIRAKAKQAKSEIEMRRIEEENKKLLDSITTMKPILNIKDTEKVSCNSTSFQSSFVLFNSCHMMRYDVKNN